MTRQPASRLVAFEQVFARGSLRTKHFVLGILGAVAIATPSLVRPVVASNESSAIREMREMRVPSFQSLLEARESLASIRSTVELAGASAEADALRRVDAHSSSLGEALDKATRLGALSGTDPDVAEMRTFATASRTAVEHALAHGRTADVSAEVGRVLTRYDVVRTSLSEKVEAARDAVANGQSVILSARRRAQWISVALALALGFAWLVLARRWLDPSHRQLDAIESVFVKLADGDFSTNVDVVSQDDLGVLAKRTNETSNRMSDLVNSIRKTGAQLNSAAAEMSATSHQHQRGASEQSSAVEETQRTMQSMLASMDQINASLDTVLRNAELTQEKNQRIAESIVALSNQADGIAEVLATIKDIANKAELLALNAALEGTKAGEVGRGFSLVATQMQRLAENVQRAVADIKQLTESIRRASTASVLSTEEGTKLAADTTRSAREIRLVMQQHQTATRQVSVAMDDVAQVASQTASSSREILASSQDLAQLSERLLDATTRIGRRDLSNGASPS